MKCSDESAVCAQRISQSFIEDVAYALSQLRMQHLKLKEEQQRAIEAIYAMEMTFLSLCLGFEKSMFSCPFLFD